MVGDHRNLRSITMFLEFIRAELYIDPSPVANSFEFMSDLTGPNPDIL